MMRDVHRLSIESFSGCLTDFRLKIGKVAAPSADLHYATVGC
jgi:hypothetical protein